MRYSLFSLLFLLAGIGLTAQETIQQKATLTTRWTKNVTPDNAWQQYPRPQMQRTEWKNLNGLWEYAILQADAGIPSQFDGKILVPFPVESFLSGVQKKVSPGQKLVYHTTFNLPSAWQNKDVILHIGACDWESEIIINGKSIGKHRGGYDRIDLNITAFLQKGNNNLLIEVKDPTDTGWQAVGKQVLKPGGIFYTSATGIWQTVWLEPVSRIHIQRFNLYPDIDKSELLIRPEISNSSAKTRLKAVAYFKGNKVAENEGKPNEGLVLKIPDAKFWTPENPELYDLELVLTDENKVVDQVKSYFGMRKISVGKWTDGFTRILLNNKFVFQNGPLDQGFWPDGIYTQPDEEALKYDLTMVKKMGFNMLRKHVKVEPDRFYYWCDKMGILVWQDMPNGDKKIDFNESDITRSFESESQYRQELKSLIDQHFNHPSIIMWVPFNEGWGQFKTAEIVDLIKKQDPTRIVNNASGWADRGVGDVLDIHSYPEPQCPDAEEKRAIVIGEFGGLGLKVAGHMWENTNWGYQTISSSEELTDLYSGYYQTISAAVSRKGLSAVVYTQLTDVETEANGLMTYDREITKIKPVDAFLINTLQDVSKPEILPSGMMLNKGDIIRISGAEGSVIRFTTDGGDPDETSEIYTEPLVAASNITVKARAFKSGKPGIVSERKYSVTDLKRPVYIYPFSSKYTAGGDFALIDGIQGTDTFNDGKWQGFEEVDLDITIDLQLVKEIKTISVNFIENQDSWIFLPQTVEFFSSVDGKDFSTIGRFGFKTEPSEQKNVIKTIRSTDIDQQVRFVKIKAKNVARCPQWHKAQGGKAWLFTDEIKID